MHTRVTSDLENAAAEWSLPIWPESLIMQLYIAVEKFTSG